MTHQYEGLNSLYTLQSLIYPKLLLGSTRRQIERYRLITLFDMLRFYAFGLHHYTTSYHQFRSNNGNVGGGVSCVTVNFACCNSKMRMMRSCRKVSPLPCLVIGIPISHCDAVSVNWWSHLANAKDSTYIYTVSGVARLVHEGMQEHGARIHDDEVIQKCIIFDWSWDFVDTFKNQE